MNSENEKLRALLSLALKAHRNPNRINFPYEEIHDALSQQAVPVEPAPAQDERSPEQLLPKEEIENIARHVYRECCLLPGATFQHAAEVAVMHTLERIARPAQAEQQPIGYACQADLDWGDEPVRICRDRFRDWQVPVYAAPIAHQGVQSEQQTQWISVKTQLPEKRAGVFYLAVNSAGYMDKISRITKCNQPADVAPITTYSGWLDEHGRTDCTIGDVTHWLPLPAAPTP